MPPRVRFTAQRPRHAPVQRLPFGHPRVLGEPEHPGVVAVARRDQPAGTAHPPHLGERRDRVGQVLHHLVRVHHVERVVVEAQLVHVADLEADVSLAPAVRFGPGQGQHIGSRVDPGDVAVGDERRQVRGDGARAAADVEHPRAGAQPGQQVGGRVLRGPPPVRSQHAVVVAVQVGIRIRGS